MYRGHAKIIKSNNRNLPIIGTNTNIIDVEGVKLGFLHVYRLKNDTTNEMLQNYLKKSAPDIKFNCELLNKNESSCSFKVGFPLEKEERVYESSLWPAGAAVRKFRFFRKKEDQTHPKFQQRDRNTIH